MALLVISEREDIKYVHVEKIRLVRELNSKYLRALTHAVEISTRRDMEIGYLPEREHKVPVILPLLPVKLEN